MLTRPTPESYWVQPGLFLAGKYPGSSFAENTQIYLEKLLDAGVSAFVDLTEPGELNPYQSILEQITAIRGCQAAYYRQAVVDRSVPTVEQMVAILDLLDRLLAEGQILYLHCHAGVNRTGTVVGCWLARHGTVQQAALDKLANLRVGTISAQMGVTLPSHALQREMIVNWSAGK